MKAGWSRVFIISVATTMLALVVLPPWFARNPYRPAMQKQWISDTIRELEQAKPLSLSFTNRDGEVIWTTENGRSPRSRFILFTNGWAAYQIHSMHWKGGFATAMLRTSDGAYYINQLHFNNIFAWIKGPIFEAPPGDFQDFLENYGYAQDWVPISLDGRIFCAVVLLEKSKEPHPKFGKKSLAVWVNERRGDGETNLYEGRIRVTGSYVCWKTRWLTNGQIAVDVCEYPGMNYAPDINGAFLRSNYLTTLTLQRDSQTGRFMEVK